MSKRRLGKGIDALLQGRPLDELTNMSSILLVDVANIAPNPDQPRKQFNQKTLDELADSIREKGIIQPIIAEDRGDGTYIIVAGERRYRAAKLAGLTEVPVISQDFSDEEKLEIALIENIQREDLNPIDEARALQSAIDHAGITQEQLAKRLGKSRPAVANTLRLLRLEPEIQEALLDATLTAGHARALLAVADPAERIALFRQIRSEGLSVRDAELAVRDGRSGGRIDEPSSGHPEPPVDEDPFGAPDNGRGASRTGSGDRGNPAAETRSVELRRIEDQLVEHLGTRVAVRGNDEHGRIEIWYLSTDDLERIIEAMGARISE